MKTSKLYLLIVVLILSNSYVKADNGTYRGIDLNKYAFGIPVKQLDFNNQTPFTLSFWVNIKEFNHKNQGTQFINLRIPDINQSSKGGGWPICDWGYLWSTIGNQFNDDENSEGSIEIGFRDPLQSTGVPFTKVKDFEFAEGEWVHVSLTYRITYCVDMAFYINGKLVQELNTNSSSYSYIWPMTWYDEYIIMVGGPAFSRAPLNAYIDKVQFYKKALSQSEIVESMTTPLLSDTSFLGCWDFEEGCNTDAEGFMFADNGTIKAAMYKILQEDDISCGSQIESFTFGEGVNTELEILGIEENIADTPKAKVFVSNEMLNIENAEGINSVVVYDAMGRVITSTNANGATSTQIVLPSSTRGMLIVKVNSEVVKVIK